ncbi:cotranscriptional regulator ARB2A isoform 7-T10 [Alca torda]
MWCSECFTLFHFLSKKIIILLCSREHWSSQGSSSQKPQVTAVPVAEVGAVTCCLPVCWRSGVPPLVLAWALPSPPQSKHVGVMMAQLQQGGPDEKEKTTALKDLLSRIDLDELMKKDEPPLEFPDTLEGFEYVFNEKGQLRHIKTGEPFVFNYREDLHRWNQKRYEALGEIITKYVYELLQKECHLKKVTLPVDASESEPKSFIFMSEDALINPDKLLVLIHGNGVVRAGQWARRLIINEDLDSGTQIPYIKRAIEEGYGVIVLNPNENYIEVEKTKAQVQLSSDSSDEPAEKRERKDKIQKETKKRRDFYEKYRNPQKEKETMQMYIRDNGSPEEHAIYVWDHFISQSAAENVFFVAHSYGGLAFVELLLNLHFSMSVIARR